MCFETKNVTVIIKCIRAWQMEGRRSDSCPGVIVAFFAAVPG
jgi:hypothetical protein